MRLRRYSGAALIAVLAISMCASPASADRLGWAFAEEPAPVTAMHPNTTVKVNVQTAPGLSYSATWTLSTDGHPSVEGSTTGELGPDASFGIPIDGSTLMEGVYSISGRVDVTEPDGMLFAPFSSVRFLVDRLGPQVASVTVSNSTIYPRIATPRYPAATDITFTGSGMSESDKVEIWNSAGARVWNFPGTLLGGTRTVLNWTGRYNYNGAPVPPGLYTVSMRDQWGNPSTQSLQVRVSTLHRVKKSYRVTVSAAGSLDDRFVGRCSQLRKPSLRRWSGSLGFYANTKCRAQTWNASAVSTVHATRLPAAFEYRKLTISTYGGAARSRPASRGSFRMLSNRREWLAPTTLKRTVRNHPSFSGGRTQWDPHRFVFADRFLAWGFVTAAGARYDVKSFTITVEYDVLAN